MKRGLLETTLAIKSGRCLLKTTFVVESGGSGGCKEEEVCGEKMRLIWDSMTEVMLAKK